MKTKIIIRYILLVTGLVIITYGSFWSYVRFGGEKIPKVDPMTLILPDPGTDLRHTIDLEGPGNFRPLGGLKSDSGFLGLPGFLFRSDCPSKYTASDWLSLKELDISMVIDLRSEQEQIDDPYDVPESMTYISNPVYREDPMPKILGTLLYERHLLSKTMQAAYIDMLQQKASSIGSTINLIGENIDKGIVFHCTAGKDRTGILSSLLLSIAGADRETILYDFSLSNNGFESNYKAFLNHSSHKLSRFGIPPDEMKILLAVDPFWMANALDMIDTKYGGIEPYLLNKAGVNKDNLVRIRQAMLNTGE
jgi:protein-tyrosine phosphatase